MDLIDLVTALLNQFINSICSCGRDLVDHVVCEVCDVLLIDDFGDFLICIHELDGKDDSQNDGGDAKESAFPSGGLVILLLGLDLLLDLVSHYCLVSDLLLLVGYFFSGGRSLPSLHSLTFVLRCGGSDCSTRLCWCLSLRCRGYIFARCFLACWYCLTLGRLLSCCWFLCCSLACASCLSYWLSLLVRGWKACL